MRNPWIKIAKQWKKNQPKDYVLPDELQIIQKYNERTNKSEYKIHTNLTPVPFIGDIVNSKIFLLQLNPGVYLPPGFQESPVTELYKAFPHIVKDSLKNICQQKVKYKFISLNAEKPQSDGFRYWTKIFKPYIKEKKDYYKISKSVCCIEYFPYHSNKFKPIHKSISKKFLDSQLFNASIVKRAIENKKLIILMRGRKQWKSLLKAEGIKNLKKIKWKWTNPSNASLPKKGKRFNKIMGLIKKTK